MALWTPDQLRRVRDIIRRTHQGFAVALFGDHAAQDVAAELKRAGLVPPDAPDLAEDPYAYGQLLARLADPSLMGATPERVLSELARSPAEPLTPAERASVDMAARHAGQYVVGLGDRVTARVMGAVTGAESSLTPDAIKDIIKDSTARNRLARQTTGQLKKDLTDQVADYTRDWQRIATTESNNAIQEGTATALEKKHHDPFVSKLPRPDACPDCMRL
ncbi:MAG TPA: hypothetical protein VFH61_01845, partial [Thermoleophilia bacterium]|nr:hypothetical protein [Thermoleophilia bacterium]